MYHEVKDQRAMGFIATKPTMIITTLHSSQVVNAGVFGAYTNLSPRHIGVAISFSSHTCRNIKETGEFVVNIPGANLADKLKIIADDIPEETSEVEAAGLSLKKGVSLKTPSIAECAAAVELVFDQDLSMGGHNFMIGKVTGGWIREDVLDTDGKIDIFKAQVMKDFKYPKPLYVVPGKIVEG